MTLPPFLTDDEIAKICDPLVMPAAQRRFLAKLGLVVATKPNGRPLVARGEFERVMVGRQPDQHQAQNQPAGQPNRAALLQLFAEKKRGTQTQGQ